VRSDEGLHRVKEERSILHKINKRKANWNGTPGGGTLLEHIEGKIEGRM